MAEATAVPTLDGQPVGPSPDALHELYVNGVMATIEDLFDNRSEDFKRISLDAVRQHILDQTIETAGLRAVWLAGRNS